LLSGPNGAGKTTAAQRLLRGVLGVEEFVNADAIAAGLSAFRPEAAALAAGRVFHDRLRALAAARESFAFETTLSSRAFAPWLRHLRDDEGCDVHLYYLWIASPALCQARVASRVARGGHAIPPDVVERRWRAGLRNLPMYQGAVTRWEILDNTRGELDPVAMGSADGLLDVDEPSTYERIQKLANS
jgi:predicted ABC-type ATPase